MWSPPCTSMHIFCAYSFPLYCDILIPLRASIAIPPLLPLFRLSSKIWYPGISILTWEGFNHVSCKHSTSISYVSNIIKSLKLLTPAIFILPIVIPYCSHRLSRFCLDLRSLVDPFVRFLLRVSFLCCLACWPIKSYVSVIFRICLI